MIDALVDILSRGYNPITYEITQQLYDPISDVYTVVHDTVVASGAAGVDWEFVLTACVLILGVYCVFRIVGAIISGVLS